MYAEYKCRMYCNRLSTNQVLSADVLRTPDIKQRPKFGRDRKFCRCRLHYVVIVGRTCWYLILRHLDFLKEEKKAILNASANRCNL